MNDDTPQHRKLLQSCLGKTLTDVCLADHLRLIFKDNQTTIILTIEALEFDSLHIGGHTEKP